MEGGKEGPSIKNIPALSYNVCNGCKFLHTQAGMRGRFVHTDNYGCMHPDADIHPFTTSLLGKGRSIHFNHEGDCTTPDWCPIKNKSNAKD